MTDFFDKEGWFVLIYLGAALAAIMPLIRSFVWLWDVINRGSRRRQTTVDDTQDQRIGKIEQRVEQLQGELTTSKIEFNRVTAKLEALQSITSSIREHS